MSQLPIDELERIAALGWRGSDVEHLGGWQLRAAHGFTGRANSALPLGSPGVPVDEALARVRAFYLARELPPRIQLAEPAEAHTEVPVVAPAPTSVHFPPPGPAATTDRLTPARLTAAGWTAGDPVLVLTCRVADLVDLPAPAADASGVSVSVRLANRPDDDWVAGYRYRGGAVPASGVEVLRNADRPVFVTVADGSGRLAVARGVVDEGWLGITAVTVEEQARRRGLATAVLGVLARWAAGAAATNVYLQVDAANTPAVTLYLARGFGVHHRYRYWVC